jgi:hypothetical protein
LVESWPVCRLEQSAARTIEHLQTSTARVTIGAPSRSAGRLNSEVAVRNLAALDPQGRVAGNDNDADPARFEPHHTRIDRLPLGRQLRAYDAPETTIDA